MTRQELTLVKVLQHTDLGVLIQINEKTLLAQVNATINTLKVGSSFLCIVQYKDDKIIIKKIDKINSNDNISLNIIS